MKTKYVCLEGGDNFVTEDESEANTHTDEYENHMVVEVSIADRTPICTLIQQTLETDETMEELEDAEMVTEEEE